MRLEREGHACRKKVILNFRFEKRSSGPRKSWNCHVKVKLNAFALCMISKFSFRLNVLYILCKLGVVYFFVGHAFNTNCDVNIGSFHIQCRTRPEYYDIEISISI